MMIFSLSRLVDNYLSVCRIRKWSTMSTILNNTYPVVCQWCSNWRSRDQPWWVSDKIEQINGISSSLWLKMPMIWSIFWHGMISDVSSNTTSLTDHRVCVLNLWCNFVEALYGCSLWTPMFRFGLGLHNNSSIIICCGQFISNFLPNHSLDFRYHA